MRRFRKQQRYDRGRSLRWLLLLSLFLWSRGTVATEAASVKRYTVQILRKIPHSRQSFTQGLYYENGFLYESTGLYGQSSLQQIDVETGHVVQKRAIPNVFAEGLTRWGSGFIQLTWKSHLAFVYAVSNFSPLKVFQYQGEGWGLTADQHALIMSDGSDRLTFRDPQTFSPLRVVRVTWEGQPVDQLNELEFIDGFIYANIWHEHYLVQIDPFQGRVVGMIDAASLLRELPPLGHEEVLNGIAYNHQTHSLYLTGKNWPTIFEVTLVPES